MILINTKYYNRSNNFAYPIKREPKPYNPYSYQSEIIVPRENNEEIKNENKNVEEKIVKTSNIKSPSAFDFSLKTDDLLLIGLIILLLPNAKDNLILILALGYLLLMGMENN